jgi:DNA-binding response OmpR family regulator
MAKILIIDDDPVYSDMTQQRLERAGHEVLVHLGPFGASAAANDSNLDLIVLDVFMPGLAGPDLLELMRKNNMRQRARVVFCSSMDSEPLARLAREHHADASISKAASRSEFLDLIKRVLSR